MQYLQLGGDDVLSVHDFYHGIQMGLNTCGKHHIDLLLMFEDLKRDNRYSNLLLPTDSQGALNNTDYQYVASMRMYHTLGQVILNSLTQSSKKVITAALSPKHTLFF